MTKKQSYLERHQKSGLKVGDTVLITRAAKSNEKGWNNVWVKGMDSYIGEKREIEYDNGISGYGIILFDNDFYDSYSFPYFVLEKVEKVKTKKKAVEKKQVCKRCEELKKVFIKIYGPSIVKGSTR